MTKFTRWTKEEDKILVRAIKANPHNKAEAIRKVLHKLNNRTKLAAEARWYKILSNPEHKKYVGCLFTMIGYRSRYDNRSVNKKKSYWVPEKSTESIWNKIKRLLGIKH